MAQFQPFHEVVFIVYAQRVAFVIRRFYDPILQERIAADAVRHSLRSTVDVEVDVLDGGLAENDVLPVGALSKDGWIRIGGFAPCVEVEFIDQLRVFRSVGQVNFAGYLLGAVVGIEAEARPLAAGAFFGGDEDDAVGPAGSVDSGGGGVFQHFHALDVVGVEEVYIVQDKAIHDVDRAGVVERTGAPDPDDGGFARASTPRRDLHTGYFAL